MAKSRDKADGDEKSLGPGGPFPPFADGPQKKCLDPIAGTRLSLATRHSRPIVNSRPSRSPNRCPADGRRPPRLTPTEWTPPTMRLRRLAVAALFLTLPALALLGCGGSSEVADSAANRPNAPANESSAQPEMRPEEVVAQFLDRIRRGGDGNDAGEMLTLKAQSELRRIGRTVQPIGSPNARFEVSRSEEIPGEAGSALVHSVWSEPGPDGELIEYQVVWAVERDPQQWRISGLAMEFEPGQDPEIIDFEDGELMAQLLNAGERQNDAPEAQTAAAGDESQDAAVNR